MKIGILTATISECDFFENILELKKLARKRNHSLDLFKNGEFNLLVDQNKTTIYYNQKELKPEEYDIILNRISVREKSNADYYIAEEFRQRNIPVINSTEAIFNARNKLRTLQILSNLGVGLTKTFIIRRYEDLEFAAANFQYPVIIKNIFGSLGSSTLLAYDYKQLKSLFDYIWNINRNEVLMIQEFISSQDKTISDYRAFIAGDEIIGAMKRTNYLDDFRANFKKGAKVEYANLTPRETAECLKISKAMNLSLAGVDFIRTDKGPVFLEVNSNPGLEGIRSACLAEGFDILDKILDFLESFK